MSQRDGFASGFLAGAVVGSVVGGIVGAVIASRRDLELAPEEESQGSKNSPEIKKAAKRRQMKAVENSPQEMETARRSLEDKIAQLNATIDEVRNQLSSVNGNSGQGTPERASVP